MLKSLFWFALGVTMTLIFAGVLIFIFGQTSRVNCRRQEPGLVSCTVANGVLGLAPNGGWKQDGVVKASVEEDCSDGCTYRTDLTTASGKGRPISEVWTDARSQDEQMAAQINAFIRAGDAPELVIDNKPAAWVIWLIVILAGMSLVIQVVVHGALIASRANPAAAAVVSATLVLLFLSVRPTAVIAAPRASTAGATRYVATSGSDASTDCSLADPCRTVQRALAVAQAGDEIHVAAGTYTGTMSDPNIDQGVSATVIISKNIAALRGGYSLDFTALDPQANQTTLSASGSPDAYVLVMAGTAALVDGFTLSGSTGACSSPGCGTHYAGGGVRIRGGTPTLSHNRIEHNFAYMRGGGIYVADGAVATIVSNVIYSNTVDGNGGGIYVQSANALISGNQILSNVAVVEGGGIYIDSNVPAVINDNAIGYNQATNLFASRGAGVRTIGDPAVVQIAHNEVYSNTLFWGGGSGLDIGGPAVIDGNSVHHNTLKVGGWGGAIMVGAVTQPVTVTNNVVYANGGSGVQTVNSTQVAFVNNTVADNRNVQSDSGTEADAYLIWFDGPPAGPVRMTVFNNILANNANCGLFFHNAPAGVTSSHNDSWNNHSNAANYCELASAGSDITSADPLFAGSGAGDYHLTFGSPAIDVGTSTPAPNHDKDCLSRPYGAGFDLGAYEWRPVNLHLGPSLNLNFKVFLPSVLVTAQTAC